MDIKIRLTFAVIVFFIVIGINGCGKIGLGCADTKFTFQTSIRAYPNKDSIRIGDTVWFEATIPTSLVDIGTKQFIDYSGAANMGTYLSIDRLTGGSIADPGGLPAAKEFRYLLINGIELNNVLPERNKEYQFLEMNKQYSLKFGIIAQKKGVYFTAIGNPKNVYRNSDKCTKASYHINFENTKQHLYFYQNDRPGYKIEGLELTNTYCFKVY